MKNEFLGKTNIAFIAGMVILPVLSALICLCIGRYSISPAEMLDWLFGGSVGATKASVLMQRVPRILTAVLVGAGLSAAGCVLQSAFSNPLATPDTLGVASGSGFGAALAILLGFSMVGSQLLAFVFGILALGLTRICGKRSGGRATMILAGVMIGSLFSSLVSLVKYVADTESQLPAITYWLMGSLNGSGFKTLSFGAPAIVIGLGCLFFMRRKLNLLPLSDDEASSLGTNVKRLRAVALACAAAITASSVSMCGPVGWVGLLVPHICRMLFGNDHRKLIPACISFGAAFLVIVDTLARSLTASEIPISILTSIIGAPFFVFILKKKGGVQL